MAEKRPTETEKAGNPEKPETIEVLLQEQLETDADLQPERDYQKFLEERERNAPAHGGTWSLFRSRREVIVVPGFMASQLSDEKPRVHGLVWIDPLRPSAMADLRLAAFESLVPEVEANSAVKIVAHDPPTGLYTNLFYNLRWYDCGVEFHPVDWRKDLEVAAYGLVQRILENRRNSTKPLFLAAHSQGALVARRALQMLGPEAARRMVQHVLLLGPANAGTFSAVLAVSGAHSFLDLAKTLHRDPGPAFLEALKTFTGLYQLFPYNRSYVGAEADRFTLPFLEQHDVQQLDYWSGLGVAVDETRLKTFEKWSYNIDTGFFADRMTILLGDDTTTGGVKKDGDKLMADEALNTAGDGTVPDAMARLPDVVAYRVTGATHMWLGMNPTVVEAATSVILNRPLHIVGTRGLAAKSKDGVIPLTPWKAPETTTKSVAVSLPAGASAALPKPVDRRRYSEPGDMLAPLPTMRRLRVFSFDPVQGRSLEGASTAVICVSIPWSDGDGAGLQAGPVGEYLEVVDVDPAAQCVYPPVNLNDPHLLAQDGMPPSEGHPWFHQQMVYAVAMKTIEQFEGALGRRSLWSPRFVKTANGGIDSQYVPRLRIYPHALAEANAYYDPERKALLFGYFGGDVVDSDGSPAGTETVFTALSYDIIAHETTHALLDGLHRYFNHPTNPDVFAFHEAFADIVALFQHFSHPEVLRSQMAKVRGDLKNDNQLGGLAMQFGQAMGDRGGALRQYIGKKDDRGVWTLIVPDKSKLAKTTAPHDRGAILVAAVFRAFLNIYDHRIADLKRIATGGTGIFDDGDLHPDLVNRLADEAAKAARHLLRMCIRALDYLPPTDVTFGEYLRALVTADYDLIKNDDRKYRIAVVSAFRDWGILPAGVRTFSEDSLRWDPPLPNSLRNLSDVLDGLNFERWDRQVDRRLIHDEMEHNRAAVHERMNALLSDEQFESLGIARDVTQQTLGNRKGKTIFAVHSIRPSRRIGPDDEYRCDLVIELVQKRKGYSTAQAQEAADKGDAALLAAPDFWMYGGSTLIVDPKTGDIRFCLRKRTPKTSEQLGAVRVLNAALAEKGNSLRGDRERQPFRMLHQHG